MIIRNATINDSEQIFNLAKEFATSFLPEKVAFEKSFAELLKEDSVSLNVAVIDDKIIGYCLVFDHYTFYANGRVSWVEEIMVQEKYRKGGVGKELMTSAEKWAKDRQSKLISLATRRAAPFYRAIGYEQSALFFRKLINQKENR
jgi:GNAT superfamily N-acetyltransferase